MARQQKLIHLHGSTQLTKDKATAVNMATGELAMMNGTTETSELYVLTSDGNIATFVTGAKVAGDIATAKNQVDTDAKGYANQALTDAKDYTDAREAVLQGEIDDAEDRIATLEGKFTGDNSVAAQIQAAVAVETKNREDADAAIRGEFAAADSALKTELQGYADAALEDAKEYADGLNTAMDTRVKELETATHTHGNKAELDKIANGDKAKWDAASTRIDTFLNGEGIDETLDTLIEIQTWMKGDGVNATELTAAIAAEAKAREDEDADIRADFADADATTLSSAQADATTKANTAETNAKAYTDAREVEIKKYADQAETDALAAAKTYTDQAEADALAAAKTYTNEVLGGNYTSANTVTTAFTTAINNAIAGIDLTGTDTGATGLDVTVEIVDGKTMTVTVDDSNLVIDCGTY